MKKLIFFLLLPVACRAQPKPNTFTVTVKLDSIKPGEIFYLEYQNYSNKEQPEVKDSIPASSDKIVFKGEIHEPSVAKVSLYRLEKVDTAFYLRIMKDMPMPELDKEMEKELMNMFLDPWKKQSFEFFLLPGDITIKAKSKLVQGKAEGPQAVIDFAKLKKDEREYVEKRMNMMDNFLGALAVAKKDSAYQEKMNKKYDSLNKLMKDEVFLGYVRANPASPLSLYALTSGMPHQIDSADKYLALLTGLAPEFRQMPSAKRMEETLIAVRNIETGRTISDFQQQDSLGNSVKYSSFKGKYVLIELWASWCLPCRKKNPGLVVIYDKYNKEKFTILGIALEQKGDKEKWLKAIQKDQLKWPQLTDFRFWDNAVARQWGIRAIPFNLLVDPTGRIIGKNLYGQELDDRLAIIFKK